MCKILGEPKMAQEKAGDNRKLSTILAMDVASYSEKMGVDEEGTIRQLKACRVIIEKNVSSSNGRIFNTAGDAFMVEFGNTLAAVTAAISIQKEIFEHNQKITNLSNRLYFRMGINLGDVMMDGDNILGEGVNIAARLEGIAPPGGICVSEIVYTTVKGKLEYGLIDKGKHKLKNIADLVTAYYIDINTGEIDPKKFKAPTAKQNTKIYVGGIALASLVAAVIFFLNPFEEPTLQLNTIALIPINANSTDEEQTNLAAGLTQDISASLIRASKKLNIIKLNNLPENLTEVAIKTGARYLITGDLRQSSNKIRVSINLVDAQNMSTVWSEQYDKKSDIENIFKLQDEIVSSVIDALVGNGDILSKEVVRAVSKANSKNMNSYACVNFVRNGFLNKGISPENFNKSLTCLKQAVKDDPTYKEAWQYYGYVQSWGYSIFQVFPKDSLSIALNAVEEAINLDANYAEAYATKAEIEYYYKNFDQMLKDGEKAIGLAPNDANTVGRISYVFGLSGWGCHASTDLQYKYKIDEKACYRLKKGHELGVRADKLDPYKNVTFDNFGRAPLYQDSKDWENLLAVMQEQPVDFMWWHHYMGTASHHLGKKDNAKKYFTRVKELLGGVNTIEALKKEAQIWHEMTVIEEMMPVYLEYGLD